ncbi:conserved hypothetical protein [Leishmania braziliensis MHOM/BR/75/M2904]|uniref:CSD domain-containing protein n=2 Tax=Leishmania braziliensis TaxID=5660 RepID=A4HJB7_LEIBR|nr:conserved hypothetical protein [Leishmania braziliensis MHOM/BR/75/M2904]CAJ2477874.1 unnamed protein product [Leishmania braziliensis]CAM42577.1 conserved hypothetical protein [Leishmania braziliensis MHOM/BR/75/M2904]SYZ68323.1 Cold-shock'_DNA-binding_domain_containing_protein [Leishmania braziliensis MHOM/BR/75/M2904]
MFYTFCSSPVGGVPTWNNMSAGLQPLSPQLPYRLRNQVIQGYPATLNNGLSVMYYAPVVNKLSPQQVSYFPMAAQRWSFASASGATQPATEVRNSMCFAPCESGANVSSNRSPLMLQSLIDMPSFMADKQHLHSLESQPSPMLSRLTRGLCSTGEVTKTFGASTTSVTSSNVGSGTSNGISTTTNGSMAPMGASSAAPGFQMTVPRPTSAMTSVAAVPQQPQACFWANHTTGAPTLIRAEDVTVSDADTTTSTHSYAMQPQLSMPSQSASASATSVPAYLVAPQVPSFGGTMASNFSKSFPGSTPLAVPALPSPPQPAKTLNGLYYQLGEVYEGFVKRYNPNRGFGFLTATTHVTVSANGDSATGTPPTSLSAPATAVPPTAEAEAPEKRRTPVHLGDIFVHQSSMQMEGFRALPVGGRVRFRIGYKDGQQTLQAVDVELLPQVCPLNVEMASSTTPVQQAKTAVLDEMTDTVTSGPRVVQPAFCASRSAASEQRLEGCALSYTSSEGDEPLIELAYDMYSSFEI